MKLVIIGLVLLGSLLIGCPARAQLDDTFTAGVSDAKDHEALVLSCVHDFTADGFAGIIAVFRIEHVGAANIDSAGIHDFAANYLRAACEAADCEDVVVKATVCAQLTQYAILPF